MKAIKDSDRSFEEIKQFVDSWVQKQGTLTDENCYQ